MTHRVLGAAFALTLLAAANAPAAGLDTLNPPPPGFYTCMPTGGGAVCHGEHADSYADAFDGTCPQGFDILENGFRVERATRFYDRDGNLVRRQLHDNWPDLPTNILFNSVTGKSVHYVSHGNVVDVLTVPGELSSLVSKSAGNAYTVTGPGGLLIKDAGLMITSPDGDVLESHGPKMLFTGATEKLCAALA